ncbi:MAG TPA: hypothetical protein VLV86_07075 [Vicinamibacterales bacterium]|nr:hypothetical protein [Vicinamibacterales bacterium]
MNELRPRAEVSIEAELDLHATRLQSSGEELERELLASRSQRLKPKRSAEAMSADTMPLLLCPYCGQLTSALVAHVIDAPIHYACLQCASASGPGISPPLAQASVGDGDQPRHQRHQGNA